MEECGYKDMITDGTPREWRITVNLRRIVDFVNVQTITDYRRDDKMNVEDVARKADVGYIFTVLSGAFANISHILARRMANPPSLDETKENMVYVLTVGDNHDDTMANILYVRIVDYLNNYALYKWRGMNVNNLDPMLDDIRSALHYRKHSVSHHRVGKFVI